MPVNKIIDYSLGGKLGFFLLSAIIGRIIVMVTKVNNEGDDKPWVSSTKAIINDPISGWLFSKE